MFNAILLRLYNLVSPRVSIPKYPDKIKSPNDIPRRWPVVVAGTFAIESHSRERAGNIISDRESSGGVAEGERIRKIKISR